MKKLSLKNAEGMLSRKEMKNIMAGSGSGTCASDKNCASGCNDGWYCSDCGTCTGAVVKQKKIVSPQLR